MIEQGLFVGEVMHRRLRPKAHRFAYRAFWFALDLDRLEEAARTLRWFSIDRFNLFSLFARDFADGKDAPLRPRIAALVSSAGFDSDGSITLLTMPRVLGYAFNPLSVYFCRDRAERPSAIVWEVSNTFGERHSYVIGVDDPDARVQRQEAVKQLHVSPFIGMDVRYRFRVAARGEHVTIGIADYDSMGALLTAALTARREKLTDRALIGVFLRIPLVTLKTVFAIHWEALRLWLKGARFRRTPAGHDKPVGAHAVSVHRGD